MIISSNLVDFHLQSLTVLSLEHVINTGTKSVAFVLDYISTYDMSIIESLCAELTAFYLP